MVKLLWQSQRALMVAGSVSLALAVLTGFLAMLDSTEILGIDRWIKPMKFFLSITAFLWTMSIYFHFLPTRKIIRQVLTWAMIAIFALEMLVITGQSVRSQPSHFNFSTPLDSSLFSLMGIAIGILTLLMIIVTLLYFIHKIALPPAVVLGLRLGLAIMLLGAAQGGYMSSRTGHSVGVRDGGQGLPLVNWSTEGGDLRVAHFLGLHGLQIIPLFALGMHRARPKAAVLLTTLFAVLYVAIFTVVLLQAMAGQPLLSVPLELLRTS